MKALLQTRNRKPDMNQEVLLTAVVVVRRPVCCRKALKAPKTCVDLLSTLKRGDQAHVPDLPELVLVFDYPIPT